MQTHAPIRLGVSACLLGHKVRYDGGHKLAPLVRDILGPLAEFVAVCPEAEAGLGLPREVMRLTGDPSAPRLITLTTRKDLTEVLQAWASSRVEALAAENLSGFILKSRSPSCGLARVPVHAEAGGEPSLTGIGLFARALLDRFPGLPVEEEGRLGDLGLREEFIARVLAYARRG